MVRRVGPYPTELTTIPSFDVLFLVMADMAADSDAAHFQEDNKGLEKDEGKPNLLFNNLFIVCSLYQV